MAYFFGNMKDLYYRLAQKYLEQQESKVPKRHLYMEELNKRLLVSFQNGFFSQRILFQVGKRYLSNLKTYVIPWEGKIKRIESKLFCDSLASQVRNKT